MGVIGFSFSKIDAERKNVNVKGGLEVKHNLTLNNVETQKINLSGKESEVLKVDFSFEVLYGKELGKVSISGDMVYTDTKEIIQETEKSWKKDKDVSQMVKEHLHRFAYGKSIVKSIEISDSLNLPSPIPLPKVSFKSTQK